MADPETRTSTPPPVHHHRPSATPARAASKARSISRSSRTSMTRKPGTFASLRRPAPRSTRPTTLTRKCSSTRSLSSKTGTSRRRAKALALRFKRTRHPLLVWAASRGGPAQATRTPRTLALRSASGATMTSPARHSAALFPRDSPTRTGTCRDKLSPTTMGTQSKASTTATCSNSISTPLVLQVLERAERDTAAQAAQRAIFSNQIATTYFFVFFFFFF